MSTAGFAREEGDGRGGKKAAREQRTGPVVAEDGELATWLHRLWARHRPPARIELWQAHRSRVRGEMIWSEDYKPADRLSVEGAVMLANELMRTAQHDVDVAQKKGTFLLCVVDDFQKVAPLTRRIGPLFPQTQYIEKGGEDGEDEDEVFTGKSLGLAYVKEHHDQVRWDKNRYDAVMGGMLQLQNGIIDKLLARLDGTENKLLAFLERTQEAEDRSLDREIVRKKTELWLGLASDGVKTARNLLTGAVASTALAKPGAAEKALLENFLHDLQKSGLEDQVLGAWEAKDGVAVCTKPGILTEEQTRILLAVYKGTAPVDALDALLPDSGRPQAITMEQGAKLMPLLPDSLKTGMHELFKLRQKARPATNGAAK